MESKGGTVRSLPTVVIVGAGFAGLAAARKFAGKAVEVVVLDRHDYHLFTPLLYQVATTMLDPSQIAQPVRSLLRRHHNVVFRLAEVDRVNLERRAVVTDQGSISYDYLVVAAGSETNFYGNGELERNSLGLKGLEDGLEIRDQVLSRFEEAHWEPDLAQRRRLLTFAVVGGGPTGVEFAGALAELAQLVLRRDCEDFDLDEVRIVLLEGSDRLLPTFRPELGVKAARALTERQVEIWYRALVKTAEPGRLLLADGRELDAGCIVWTAGVRAAGIGLDAARLKRSAAVDAQLTLQLEGHPEVFVAGDLAGVSTSGQLLPMLAPVAIQEGEHAADSILELIDGRQPRAFRYRDRGTMATIGRNSAVADLRWIRLSGFPGWVAWLLVHFVMIISLRNRLMVLVNWAWDYLLYDRPVRFILRGPRPRPWQVSVDRSIPTRRIAG